MTERNQIEIDYCPSCRGVWLDKGELDKMLEYADQNIPYLQQEKPYGFPLKQQPSNPHYNKYRKKKSFLGDLFDFD
jgi:Zn-finger nucleic acid-binding protein